MHEGETCQTYRDRIEADEQRKTQQAAENTASEATVQRVSKPCPNCNSRLDKYTGCDHVTCELL